ncbi:CBS domain-containing protein [Actinomadura chokoriensis]|uniref:CBS domain-containing protein n=1 Tax=Actinomadura chokoriensis TaxID=454156 RepID=A0ABV4QYW1_9ACTN
MSVCVRPLLRLHVSEGNPPTSDRQRHVCSHPALRIPAGTTVSTALTRMREASEQLALVTEDQRIMGVVTITDVLRRLFPRAPAPPPAT